MDAHADSLVFPLACAAVQVKSSADIKSELVVRRSTGSLFTLQSRGSSMRSCLTAEQASSPPMHAIELSVPSK
jgi:hypothetical protein